jgi:hypothetical protein
MAQSRHETRAGKCPLIGAKQAKQTSAGRAAMSLIDPKANIPSAEKEE